MKIKSTKPYDDYNSAPPRNDGIIGTVTRQIGISAPRNGWKILIEYDTD